ncbi:MAG: thiamine phosphate synthase [Planctomycetes bacterium]|nr:thiamine phosphate synthase [Planctomycetota bacterium]
MNEHDQSAVYRILDANANRAREALRVAEDAARFALERPDLAEALKRLRHNLRAALGRLDARRLVSARDTAGDVGTAISVEAERTRTGIADVAQAAFKRLCEALRAIEEYAKTLDPQVSASVEALRYRAYELEKRFEEALRPQRRLAAGGLCVLLTEGLCRHPWAEVLRAAMAGGAAAIQVREKGMPDGQFLARAREAARIVHDAGRLVIVNDRPDVAALAAADGVHVGQDDMAPHEARRIVGPDRLVGVSTHTVGQALAAAEAGADYVGCGPMFPSATKPQEVIPGPALAAEVVKQAGVPVIAIGGITAENAGAVLAAGVRWLAVSSAVCGAADPEAATRRLAELIARVARA